MRSHAGSKADRPLRQQLVEAYRRRSLRDRVVQLCLERRIRGQVVAQPERLTAVGATGSERREVIVRLVQCGLFQANKRRPALDAVAQLREPRPTAVAAGPAREIVVAKGVVLGDELPRRRVEGRVSAENVYAGDVCNRGVVAHDRAVTVYTGLDPVGTAPEQVAQVEARTIAGLCLA